MNVGFNKPDPSGQSENLRDVNDSGTVFVRGLASSVDDEKLLNRFSDVGPVRSAFVVRTGAGGASKGFGFVKYAIESDAQVAIETLNGAPMEGKILGVFPAERRSDTQEAGGRNKEQTHVSGEEKHRRKLQEREARNEKLEERIGAFSTALLANSKRRLCVLLLWNIPTKASGSKSGLKTWLSKRDIDLSRIKNIILKIDKQDPMLGAINMSSATAIEFENDKITKAAYHRLKLAKIAVRRHAAATFRHSLRQRCRLIVRNLAWSVRENDLVSIFSKFGPIHEAKVPTTPGNAKRIRGFGFVQFLFYSDAAKAVQNCNGEKLKGREIAVDWTVRPDKASDGVEDGMSADESTESHSGDTSGSEKDSDEDESIPTDNESSSEDSSDTGDVSNDQAEEADSEEEGSVKKIGESESKVDTKLKDKVDKEEFCVFVQNLPFTVTKQGVFDTFKRYGPCKMVKLVRVQSTGQHRGSAFVHYYSEQGVKNALNAAAGRIGKQEPQDQLQTKKKKKSKRQKEIASAMAEAALNGGILINERKITVLPALKKDELKTIEESRKGNSGKVKIDRRHLYLAREGFIHENDDASIQMPKGDRLKRDNIQKEKKMKLKNPNFFVSPTRLSIRNISTKPCWIPNKYLPPRHSTQNVEKDTAATGEDEEEKIYKVVDGKILKSIAINAARDGMRLKVVRRDEGDQTLMSAKDAIWQGKRVAIVESKVVCDSLETYADGKPLSRGYGFVEFTEHAHALAALRMLNNNPEYFMFTPGPSSVSTPLKSRQRLIVEFACEDARKLLKQKKNLEARKEKSLRRAAELGISKQEKKKKKDLDEDDIAKKTSGDTSSKNKKRKKRNRKKSNRTVDNPPSETEEIFAGPKKSGPEDNKEVNKSLPNVQVEKRSKRLKAIDKRGGSLLSRRERKKFKASHSVNKDSSQNRGTNNNVNFDDLVSKYKKRLEKSNILGQGSSSATTTAKKKSRWFDEE